MNFKNIHIGQMIENAVCASYAPYFIFGAKKQRMFRMLFQNGI
ncbi:hypothetical protein AAH994_08300 [Weeksellaceae bacterium A-14]